MNNPALKRPENLNGEDMKMAQNIGLQIRGPTMCEHVIIRGGCYNALVLINLIIAFSGWVAGVLVNYLADILPVQRKLSLPICPSCRSPMGLKNYFIWPRVCAGCGRRRSFRGWVVEITLTIATFWLWVSPSHRINFIIGFILLIYFSLVVVIDIEHHLILHPVSLIGVGIGLLTGAWLHGIKATLIGGIAGFGIMLGLYYLGALILRLIARLKNQVLEEEEGLGFGDVNLCGVLGLILGWPGIAGGVILAILLGGVASVIYLVVMLLTRKYRSFMPIPYGPFLVASAIILLFFSTSMLSIL
jgi:leader peptidase (prepilin peptidase) / N-methyltransferase